MRIIYYMSVLAAMFMLVQGCNGGASVERELHLPELQEGDIVFRKGGSVVSHMVLYADRGGKYSHIGVVVVKDGEFMVVHAVPGEPDFEGDTDRVKIESVDSFFDEERASSGAVMRPLVGADTLAEVAGKALELAKREVLFDHNYDLEDTTKLYCTELVDFVFRFYGMDLAEGRITHINIPGMVGDYLLPSDIYKSKKLATVFCF